MSLFDVIALDADDTLWHNEKLYSEAQEAFKRLLAGYISPAMIDEHLYETEIRIVEHFGYGIKGFALAMIEAGIELTDGRISGKDVQEIINLARQMLTAYLEPLDGVEEALERLSKTYPLMLITKGDQHEQEMKIARSGMGDYFQEVEILGDKSRASYAALLKRHHIEAARFLMVGNSLRSDILPVLEIGANAVYIPYPLTWAHEAGDLPPAGQPRFYTLERMGELPGLLERIEGGGE